MSTFMIFQVLVFLQVLDIALFGKLQCLVLSHQNQQLAWTQLGDFPKLLKTELGYVQFLDIALTANYISQGLCPIVHSVSKLASQATPIWLMSRTILAYKSNTTIVLLLFLPVQRSFKKREPVVEILDFTNVYDFKSGMSLHGFSPIWKINVKITNGEKAGENKTETMQVKVSKGNPGLFQIQL